MISRSLATYAIHAIAVFLLPQLGMPSASGHEGSATLASAMKNAPTIHGPLHAAAMKSLSWDNKQPPLADALRDLPKTRGIGQAEFKLTIGGGGKAPEETGGAISAGSLPKILKDLGYQPVATSGADGFQTVVHKFQDNEVYTNVGVVGVENEQYVVFQVPLVDLKANETSPPLSLPFLLMNRNFDLPVGAGFYINTDSLMLSGTVVIPNKGITPTDIAGWIGGLSELVINTADIWHPSNW